MGSHSSTFVGRSRELDALDALFGTAPIWIWGPPGVGKSRLAYEWLDRRGRAMVSDLSTCTTDDEFLSQIRDDLRLATADWNELRAAARELEDTVLLFDNVDPIRATVERFTDGLPHAVVTCRAAPSSQSKVSIRVEPLSADEARALFDAVADEGTKPDEGTSERLLTRLDGIPLAIEFAARRLRLITADEQLRRLEVGEGSALDGVIAWMWQELSPAQRSVLVQCSVFAGPFTALAVESTAAVDDVDVLAVLDELLTASWLQRHVDTEVRFRLLHSLRTFALHATPPEDLAAARDRALTHWADQVGTLRRAVEGPDGARALRRLQVESATLIDLVRAGLHAQQPRALVLLEALRWNACLIGPTDVYRDLVAQARALAEACDHAVAARFLDFAAEFGRVNARLVDGEHDARAAVDRARQANDEQLLTQTLITLSRFGTGATGLAQQSENLQRAEGFDLHLERARALEGLGECRKQLLDFDAAWRDQRDAVDTYRAYASEVLAIQSRRAIAVLLRVRRRHSEAMAELVQIRDEADQAGLYLQRTLTDLEIARTRLAAGDLSRETIDQVIADLTALGVDGRLVDAWIALARTLWAQGERSQATGAARTAHRTAPSVGHPQGGAIAGALVAMFLWADGRTAMDDDLLTSAQTLQPTDPLAALAHLVAFIGVRAFQGSAAQTELHRAVKLADLLTAHPEAASLARTLIEIGRAFAELCDAAQAENAAPLQAARARLDALQEPDGLAEDEFYVHLLLGQARELLARLEDNVTALPAELRHDVLFHANCHWIRIDGGEPIDLNSRKQLRVIVKALARQYFNDPTVLLSVEELLEVGWPGEAMTASSGRSRIYTAIRDLRKLGLGELIVTEDGGYRLVQDVRYRVADPTGILAEYES